MRFVGRILGVLVSLILVVAGAVLLAYYSGTSLPVRQDTVPLSFPNWNKTGRIQADMSYDGAVARQSGRIRANVDLRLPGATGHLKSFLDGGRERIVRCGPQDLYLQRLVDAQLAIEGNTIAISGHADMELDGLIKAKDDLPVAASVSFGHSATEIWLELASLKISSLPDPVSDALVRDIARVTATRDQVLDVVIARLPEDHRPLLRTHRDALDLRFERLVPRLDGDTLWIAAEISVREGVVPEILSDYAEHASAGPVRVLAELLAPARAHADFFKELKKIGKQLEGAGRQVEKELKKSGDPVKAIASLINDSGICTTPFGN